jgi:hypothetical protein
VLVKSLELLNSAEKLNELGDSSAEQIEFTENLVRTEFELFTFGHVHKPFLGDLILLLVSKVKVKATLENRDKFFRRELFMVPQDVIIRDDFPDGSIRLVKFSHLLVVEDVELAVVDHLVSDLNEEASH